jgi:hypothetical protein
MIYFCGDVHGNLDIQKLKQFKDSGRIDKDDILIQTGDLGIVWSNKEDSLERDLKKFYDSLGFKKILFIPGNHENYNRLLGDEFPLVNLNEINGEAKQISNNVYMLLSGNIYTINEKKVFCFRGAKSIDKDFRIKDVSWWSNEIPNVGEYEMAKSRIRNKSIDYFVTHTGSRGFKDKLFGRSGFNDTTEEMISNIKDSCEYKAHICGHYHLDVKSINSRTVSLYNIILSEEEILDELKGKSNKLEYVNE